MYTGDEFADGGEHILSVLKSQQIPCSFFLTGNFYRYSGFEKLINYTTGTVSHTDYTTPDMPEYRSSDVIYQSIIHFERENTTGLNGFILLIHIGTAPERNDKFYYHLEAIITELKARGYQFKRIDDLLK